MRAAFLLGLTLGTIGCAPKALPLESMEGLLAQQVAEHRQQQREQLWGYHDGTVTETPFLTTDDLRSPKLLGFYDLHAHQTNEHGFAGRAIYGGDAPCDGLSHGARPEIFNLIAQVAPGALEDEMFSELAPHCPTSDFPTHDSFAHEQYSPEQLHRAWKGGLRLMVNYAGNNSLICTVLAGFDRGAETSCRDHPNIERQLVETWAFAEEHGWYEVVLDPLDAVQAMERGHLAVVLGVEASDYFADARFRGGILGGDPHFRRRHRKATDLADLHHVKTHRTLKPALSGQGRTAPWASEAKAAWLKKYQPYDPVFRARLRELRQARAAADHLEVRGVRAAFLAHEWPSELSGSALQFPDLFNAGYFVAKHYGAPEKIGLPAMALALVAGRADSRIHTWPIPVEMRTDPDSLLRYPAVQSGLTPMGALFVDAVAGSDLMLDLTHVSEKAAYELTDYLHDGQRAELFLLNGHLSPRELSMDQSTRWEYFPSRDMMVDLAKYGRVALGVRTGMQPQKGSSLQVANCARRIDDPSRCVEAPPPLGGGPPATVVAPGDSVSLYQVHHYLQSFGLPMGFGTDMNGFTTQVAPRWVWRKGGDCVGEDSETCVPEPSFVSRCLVHRKGKLVAAPCGTSGYARDGLATVGYLPELVADIGCLEGRPGTCAMAFGADPTVAPTNVCALMPGSPLCQGPRGFLQRWAGLAKPDTVNPATLDDLRPVALVIGLPSLDDALFLEEPTELARVLPTAAPSLSTTGPAGPYQLLEREAARRYLRELRRGKLIGKECKTVDEFLAEEEK